MNIKTAKFVVSNQNVNDCPKENIPEYAFIGRSNVGKSSLINMLANSFLPLVASYVKSKYLFMAPCPPCH